MSVASRADRTALSTVHVVVPDGIDDPARPSGGNTYDREVCRSLTAGGWYVREHATPGRWPSPDAVAAAGLTRLVGDLPHGAVVLIDGLVASAAAEVLLPLARQLRLVVLVHLPLGVGDPAARAQEEAVLGAARAVVTTSAWTRVWLLETYGLSPDTVHVAEPGVRPARVSAGTSTGGELLCVAAVTPGKGHADLFAALARNADLPWRCVCVGTLDRAPELVEQLRRQLAADGISDRVELAGPRTGETLDNAYAAADVLLLWSHAETYGMVVTEALARGLPVIATAVGGVPQAMGWDGEGQRPGLLVEPGDPLALAAALRRWLSDDGLRRALRAAAARRRQTLSSWQSTADELAGVLTEAAR